MDDIVDAGYYEVVIKGLDGQPIDQRVSIKVNPAELKVQLSNEGQVLENSTSSDTNYQEYTANRHFAYTGEAVSPKFDFFQQDDDGDYAEVTVNNKTVSETRYVAISELTEAQRGSLTSADRYKKVDVDASAYTVNYFDGKNSVAPADLKEKGTYTYNVWDNTPGVTDNYTFTSEYGDTIRISDERVFDDVASDAWYAQVVNDAYNKGYVHGIAGTKLYAPESSITRADVACILFNVAQSNGHASSSQSDYRFNDDYGYETGFDDVDGHQYYAQAIAWAKATGVVNGYGDGTFKPTQSVTREEFAAMLANYAKLVRNYEAGSTSELDAFPDGSAVSDWAKDVVAWAVHNKVMGNGGFINPQGSITRAETAAMVMNFDAIKR